MTGLLPKPKRGWKTWGYKQDRCAHCCTGMRCECDVGEHIDRDKCPYCLSTGDAIWMTNRFTEKERDYYKRLAEFLTDALKRNIRTVELMDAFRTHEVCLINIKEGCQESLSLIKQSEQS